MDSPDDHDSLVARLRAAGCVFAEEEAALLLAAPGELAALVERRIAGEPLETVLGWAEVDGLRMVVRPGVFVPRRRTALLAREAVRLLPADGGRMLDVCCGVAPVAALVLRERGSVAVVAGDLDPTATACAAENLAVHPDARVVTGDLFAAFPAAWRGTVDVVAANAPYVPSARVATMPSEARDHEPLSTLDGGADGLEVHRRIAAEVAQWLRPGGHLVVEVSTDQAPTLLDVLAAHGLVGRVVVEPELDATAVVGRWDPGGPGQLGSTP